MALKGQLLPDHPRVQKIESVDSRLWPSTQVAVTRDHELIKRWAAERQAEPATGEATSTGPATVNVQDGGAGIRFNFPGFGAFRPISWDEWLANFDHHGCAFVFETDSSTPLSTRYRIVRADDVNDLLR